MQEFNGMDYLRIDIAGSYGLDKLTWDERLAWFRNHENKLETLWEKADKPAMYLAGIDAYKKALKREPTGYMVNLDATHSGLQMLSLLTGDIDAAKLCNVINDDDKRNDSYTLIINKFMHNIGKDVTIPRKHVKKAIMTAFYNSTARPRELVGEKLYPVFCNTLEQMAPYCWSLTNFMLEAWNPNATEYDWDMPDGFHVHLPVEFMVEDEFTFGGKKFTFNHEVVGTQKQGRSLGANLTHSVDALICREMTARCMYNFDKLTVSREVKNLNANSSFLTKNTLIKPKDKKSQNKTLLHLLDMVQQTGYKSMRILDMVSSDNFWVVPKEILEELIDSLPDKPFQILTIHDCYRCHPNYGNDVRKQYRICLQELANSNLLEHILQSIVKSDLQVNKASTITVDGEYALS